MPMSQKQHFWKAHKRTSDMDKHVMAQINDPDNPLTAKDLHALADLFPERWEKYRNLLDKKKTSVSTV